MFCLLFFIDRGTKIAALFLFSAEPYSVIPGVLRFSLYLHTKSIFFFDGLSIFWIGGIFFLFLCAMVFMGAKRNEQSAILPAALIAAGAASNLLDIARYGSIIDWIEIPGLTVFNFADGLIVVGCVGLLFSVLCKKHDIL